MSTSAPQGPGCRRATGETCRSAAGRAVTGTRRSVGRHVTGRRRPRRVILFILSASAASELAIGVARPGGCDACEIRLTRKARLGSAADSSEPSRFLWVTPLRQGGYVVAPTVGWSQLLFYDANGRMLRLFGRQGPGPGEFGVIGGAVQASRDSIYVIERAPRRVSVFDRDMNYARMFRLPGDVAGGVAVRTDGSLVVPHLIRTPELLGIPVHIYAADGARTASFGADGRDYSPETASSYLRRVGLAHDGTIWVAHVTRYRLEQWSVDGRLLRSIERNPDWFEPWDGPFPQPDQVRPPTRISAIWPVDERHVAVMLLVPDPHWRQLRPEPRDRIERSGESGFPSWTEYRQLYDTLVEVLDVGRGTVVARRQMDGMFSPTTVPMVMYAQRDTPDGTWQADVWQVALTSRR